MDHLPTKQIFKLFSICNPARISISPGGGNFRSRAFAILIRLGAGQFAAVD